MIIAELLARPCVLSSGSDKTGERPRPGQAEYVEGFQASWRRAFRDELERLASNCVGGHVEGCRIIEILAGFGMGTAQSPTMPWTSIRREPPGR